MKETMEMSYPCGNLVFNTSITLTFLQNLDWFSVPTIFQEIFVQKFTLHERTNSVVQKALSAYKHGAAGIFEIVMIDVKKFWQNIV